MRIFCKVGVVIDLLYDVNVVNVIKKCFFVLMVDEFCDIFLCEVCYEKVFCVFNGGIMYN